jgi:predicted AAA+ superfamily ATPase
LLGCYLTLSAFSGIKVMLNRGLAELYGVKTRVLNQAVNRNIERFPEDFMLSLTREEIIRMSQIVISSEIKFSKSVRCFTQQGVAVLSSVLRSKRTIANYFNYLAEAFFVIANGKFSFSPRQRIMNPKKVYLTDTGFAGLGRPFSENRGRIIENIVAIELFRRGMETYYFKNRNECDFIVKKGRTPTHAIQVCRELNGRNEKREIGGLVDACGSLGLNSGTILTYDQEEKREKGGLKISVQPVWRWLLETDMI